jgi:hypothetical protein
MQENTWAAIASGVGQKIRDCLPSPVPATGLSGENPESITLAWCGASVDQRRGEYILCANGGHADYAGNETYALSLRSSNPAWRRLTNPTPNGNIGDVSNEGSGANEGLYADGRPRSMHNTFQCFGDGRVWMPAMNSVTSGGGGFCPRMISFNRDMLGEGTTPLAWTGSDLGAFTNYGINASINRNIALFGVAVFDKATHRAYGLAGNGANNTHWWYMNTIGPNIGTGQTFSAGHSWGHFGGWAVSAWDLGILVAGDILRQTICVLNIAANTWTQISNVTGSGLYSGGSGGVYVAKNNTIGIGLPRDTNRTIYKLQIPTTTVNGRKVYNSSGTWAWTQINPSGPDINVGGAGSGAYSKWNLIEDMGDGRSGILYIGDIDEATFVYKIPAAGL